VNQEERQRQSEQDRHCEQGPPAYFEGKPCQNCKWWRLSKLTSRGAQRSARFVIGHYRRHRKRVQTLHAAPGRPARPYLEASCCFTLGGENGLIRLEVKAQSLLSIRCEQPHALLHIESASQPKVITRRAPGATTHRHHQELECAKQSDFNSCLHGRRLGRTINGGCYDLDRITSERTVGRCPKRETNNRRVTRQERQFGLTQAKPRRVQPLYGQSETIDHQASISHGNN
jgi:hypothetical protein